MSSIISPMVRPTLLFMICSIAQYGTNVNRFSSIRERTRLGGNYLFLFCTHPFWKQGDGPMGYTVVSAADDEGAQGSGLTLAEAFTRMMAFARCDYAFGRSNGDMHLSLAQSDDAPE